MCLGAPLSQESGDQRLHYLSDHENPTLNKTTEQM